MHVRLDEGGREEGVEAWKEEGDVGEARDLDLMERQSAGGSAFVTKYWKTAERRLYQIWIRVVVGAAFGAGEPYLERD